MTATPIHDALLRERREALRAALDARRLLALHDAQEVASDA